MDPEYKLNRMLRVPCQARSSCETAKAAQWLHAGLHSPHHVLRLLLLSIAASPSLSRILSPQDVAVSFFSSV